MQAAVLLELYLNLRQLFQGIIRNEVLGAKIFKSPKNVLIFPTSKIGLRNTIECQKCPVIKANRIVCDNCLQPDASFCFVRYDSDQEIFGYL